jgi:hypothetical protein
MSIAIVLKELEDAIISRLDAFRLSASGGFGLPEIYTRAFRSLDEGITLVGDQGIAAPCGLLSLPALAYSDLTAANTKSTRADADFILALFTNDLDQEERNRFYRGAVQLFSSELVEDIFTSAELPAGWSFDYIVPVATDYVNDEELFGVGFAFRVRIRSNVTCLS